ncbi:hypothetical protein [Tabrizicola sp.]|uniref:hypothetical protein n=1 Tax=Tabrizicola sp. TaxID=2005166 RepID=UPI003F417077
MTMISSVFADRFASRTRALRNMTSGLAVLICSATIAVADGLFESEFLDRILDPMLADQPFMLDGLAPFSIEESGAQRFRNVDENFAFLVHEAPDFRLAVLAGFLWPEDHDPSRDHLYWVIEGDSELNQAIRAFEHLGEGQPRIVDAPQCIQHPDVDLAELEIVFQSAFSFSSEDGTPGIIQMLVYRYRDEGSAPDSPKVTSLAVTAGASARIPCLEEGSE